MKVHETHADSPESAVRGAVLHETLEGDVEVKTAQLPNSSIRVTYAESHGRVLFMIWTDEFFDSRVVQFDSWKDAQQWVEGWGQSTRQKNEQATETLLSIFRSAFESVSDG